MKIKSSKKKTGHILVALTAYAPWPDEEEFMDYGYLYFHLNDFIKRNVKKFQKNWANAKLRVEKFPVQITNAVLIRTELVYDDKNDINLNKKYFKYDSLNHLADQPEFEENDWPYGIMATILCYFDFFEIEVERIPDGYRMPLIIYRSPRFIYSKLLKD